MPWRHGLDPGWRQAAWIPTLTALIGLGLIVFEAVTQPSPRPVLLSLYGLMVFGPAGFLVDRLRQRASDPPSPPSDPKEAS